MNEVGAWKLMMRRVLRSRRKLKWCGVGVCAAILCMWAASLSHEVVGFYDRDGGTDADPGLNSVSIRPGVLHLRIDRINRQNGPGLWTWTIEHVSRSRRDSLLTWFGFGLPSIRRSAWATDFFVPLWSLLILPAFPTVCFFRSDRRRQQPGHCVTCGYNLTGNVSGVCSECGLRLTQPGGSARALCDTRED